MKIITSLILILLMQTAAVCHAQQTQEKNPKMSKEVTEILKLGKDAIVASALNSIGGSISLENFTSATVLSNGEEVYVSFRNQYKYLPINKINYFDVGVNITTQTTYKNSVANPYNFTTERAIPYFNLTEDIKKHISFVKQAIGNLDGFEDDMIIRDNVDFYAIEVVSDAQESSYKIKKKTGEIYDEFHAYLEPIPFDVDDSEEFKEVIFSVIED
ncbi:hypothetical protein CLV90_1248 [Maribacter spongiicola]|uniref:Outer membrane lipoprotein-sorting protein n=1 Tax=Maribacter spongiicola TaxID=1206753 RepID=A0A4R7K7A0_9FLAO|nr:hypothetical protein [Maribacter spongiicola]TDT47176.1 hypothetical protein CLV90_1248 [Maribacter spongiicola]